MKVLVLVDHHNKRSVHSVLKHPVFSYKGSHNNFFRVQNLIRISCYHATQTEFGNVLDGGDCPILCTEKASLRFPTAFINRTVSKIGVIIFHEFD